MTALWTAQDAADATGGRTLDEWNATGVSIDSRNIAPGDLFVALSGPNHDAHDYVEQALADGAVAAIVRADWAEEHGADKRLLAVEDPMAALEALAAAARARSDAKVVAVTGSVGKTGTKEMLALALGRLGHVHKTEGNLNNHIGLPLTLARMPIDTDYAVIEMGMNQAGELSPLSRLVRPDVAIITTIEAVHLEHFDGLSGIAEAKAEIFEGMDGQGAAVLNRDNAMFHYLRDLAGRAGVGRIHGFGAHPDAVVQMMDCSLQPSCSTVRARIVDETLDYCLGAPGRHWVFNSLSVLAAIHALGGDVVEAARAFSDIRPPKGRGAYRRVALADGEFGLIDESYNASPASTKAAIQVLSRATGDGRRIAVLGDMLELGEDAPQMHTALAGDLTRARIDLVFTAGPLMKHLHEALPEDLRGTHADESEGLIAPVTETVRAGDTVMVKGSLGSRMAPVVAALEALSGSGAPIETVDGC